MKSARRSTNPGGKRKSQIIQVSQHLNYSTHIKPYYNPNKPDLPLTPALLSTLDEGVEERSASFEERSRLLRASIQASYEGIKGRFLGLLDSVYQEIYELVEEHSKYVKYGRVVRKYRESRETFKTENKKKTRDDLMSSVKNLFDFESLFRFPDLVDCKSIRAILRKSEEMFEDMILESKEELPEYPGFHSFLESKYEEDFKIFEMLRLANPILSTRRKKEQENLVESILLEVQKAGTEEKPKPKPKKAKAKLYQSKGKLKAKGKAKPKKKITKLKSSMVKTKKKLLSSSQIASEPEEVDSDFFRSQLALSEVLGEVNKHFSVGSQIKDEVEETLISKDLLNDILTRKIEYKGNEISNCYPLKNNLILFESVAPGQLDTLESVTSPDQKGFCTTLDLVQIIEGSKIKNLSSTKFNGKILNLTLSPSREYVGIEREEGLSSLLFCLSKMNFYAIVKLKKFQPRKLVFIDSPKGEKLVFLTSGGVLHVFDLKYATAEFVLEDQQFRSIHYIDYENILVVSTGFLFGVFSFKTKQIANLIELTEPQTGTSKPKSEGKIDTPPQFNKGSQKYTSQSQTITNLKSF